MAVWWHSHAKESGKQAALVANAEQLAKLSEVGKNLATKADITEITTKIEAVKLEYARQLEQTKSTLTAQLTQHGFRYKREFEMLEELCKDLVYVRTEAGYLRSVYTRTKDSETRVDRGVINKLLQSIVDLADKIDRYEPFIAPEVFTAINNVCHVARDECVACLDDPNTSTFEEWLAQGKANDTLLQSLMDIALKSIRQRTVQWDELAQGPT
ncbi:hypothetical protein WJ973_16245 [Achromobacter xylosoxidans]